jgi:RNA polymerase sigma-70 factor (ECF subfamily)
MYAIALKILAKTEDAEDALQEAFIRIADNIGRIQELPCPKRIPFCVVVVKNVSKNMLRDRKKTTDIDEIDNLPDADSDPQDEFFTSLDSTQLAYAIKQLTPQDNDVILMRWGKKMPYKAIGKVLGISEEAASKRSQRALAHLRTIYLKEFPNE